MSEGQSAAPDQADRYFLYAIGVDVDLDAQLDAIQNLVRRNRVADQHLIDEMKRAEDRARAATGLANELAIDDYGNAFHASIYQDAAHSLAAVGMLAPLLESIIHQSFDAIHTNFAQVLVVAPPRSSGTPVQMWDCSRHVLETGRWSKDFVKGTLQLAESIGLARSLPDDAARTLRALFAYRNKNFHFGLEWPAKERASFQARLEREEWTDWFSQSTSGDRPWVIHMRPAFVDHCLDLTERLLDAFGKFVFETQRRMPPDPNVPNFLRSGS